MSDGFILGINAYDHDTAACLLRGGEIAFAISKERLTRIKHDRGSFQVAVDYCLDAAGISLDDVELVVANTYVLPVPEFEGRVCHFPDLLHGLKRNTPRGLLDGIASRTLTVTD